MKYVKDKTGRFDQRPHFDSGYIDEVCERTLLDFIDGGSRPKEWPISTDTLTTLIERDTKELDLFTKMADHGLDERVEGFTEYSGNNQPSVYINENLSSKSHESRLRTTLSHEYGHVLLHGPLFKDDSPCRLLKPPQEWSRPVPRTISQRNSSADWMEWQANYAMGALLMPKTAVQELAELYAQSYGFRAPFSIHTGHAQALTTLTCRKFFVSFEAASIRLKHMCLIVNS